MSMETVLSEMGMTFLEIIAGGAGMALLLTVLNYTTAF